MKYVPVFSGIVTGGRFVPDNPEQYEAYLRTMEGTQIHLHFKRRSKPHSDEQRGYYWGVVLQIISEYSGHTPAELHEAFKVMFLSEPDNTVFQYRVRSTEMLAKSEYSEFISKIITFASVNLGCVIPSSEEMQRV